MTITDNFDDASIRQADHVSDRIVTVLNQEFAVMRQADDCNPAALFAGIALALHAMGATAPQADMPIEMRALLAAAGLYLRMFHLMHGGDWRPSTPFQRPQ
jgi:hypothetical protein